MDETTPTGIRIVDCAECGRRHPATRSHCPVCGKASLYGHDHAEVRDA